jgi:pimeloyl-ACP methyl ester carboxylesterase
MTAAAGAPSPRELGGEPAHRFVVHDGVRLHLLDWGGDGRPIVLLHGVGGHARMWTWVSPALAALGRPIALDMRGFGDSQWSPDAAYSTDAHSADLEAVCDRLGLDEIDLVGFSWGGLVALDFAARLPGRVRRLAIIDIAPSTPSSAESVPEAFRGQFADHADAVGAEQVLAPRAGAEQLEVMAAFGTRSHPGGGLVRKSDPAFLSRWPFRDDDRWAQLGAIRSPTLVVRAADSPTLPDADARRMAAELPDGRVETIRASGHLVALEQPDALRRVLVEHLSD